MNSRRLIILLLILTSIFTGCDMVGMTSDTPTAEPSDDLVTYTPANTIGITPNVTEEMTVGPTEDTTVSPTVETTPTPTAVITAENTTIVPTANPNIAENKQAIQSFLPSLNTRLDFYGIAETGHYGQLAESYIDDEGALYVFSGTYNDGMGVPDEFTIQYFCDFERGTVTEKALYNERLDKNEFHSKLHNIVVLKFPLSLGATWSHETTINGSKHWVYAEVIEYDGTSVKVLYTAPGVPDYHDETYFEMRTYETGYGMTSFGNIMPGALDLSGVDTSDEDAVKEYIMNMYMFGYSLNK